MSYFQSPLFDLLKFGQSVGTRVTRTAFARHVVDLAAKLVEQTTNIDDMARSQELLHDQIARLHWQTFIWIFPVRTHRLDYSIYPAEGYSKILPASLLGTALLYRGALNSRDWEDQRYARLMVRTGLEWACLKAEYEGRPNPYNDMPELDANKLNSLLRGGAVSTTGT